MKKILPIAILSGALTTFAQGAAQVEITLGDAQDGHDVPASLWGIFFEDINWGADGGLNPEMLANGGFDWLQADHEKWDAVNDGWVGDFRDGGMARLSIQMNAPVHPNTARHLRIESFGKGLAGVKNHGLDGMWLDNGEPYALTFNWRILDVSAIDYEASDWRSENLSFVYSGTDLSFEFPFGFVKIERDGDKATFSILVTGRRAVEFDNVSLMPTGPNKVRAGMRKDLVDHLAALKPAFVRFPGGCIVEEGDFQHWYDWRRTVGPKVRRECILNRWTRPGHPYWETFAIGYYEYFILCEELGAEPLPICLAGLTCQYQKPEQRCAVEDADYFANVVLELIEFANGPVDSKWGAVRAQMGHPKPFNLKMVGIGNENWDAEFFDRAEPICKIIREKYPEIKIVGSSGPAPDDNRFRYAWNRVTKESADLVDEHYYRDPNWFLKSVNRYDNYDRENKPKVYAGEYACHHKIGKEKPNTLWSAICEAAAMTGFERNSDVVVMASYAPLFARLSHNQWAPNLIWFDGQKSFATPNYYVQQLFSLYRPDRTVPVTVTGGEHIYACAGVKDGKIVIKLVNANENETSVKLNFKGDARVTVLSGEQNAVNSIDMERVKPVTTEVSLDGSISLAPLSLTVVEQK